MRIATLADIQHVFTQLYHSTTTTHTSTSTSTSTTDTFTDNDNPTTADCITVSNIELAGEMLGYSLSKEEVQDCITFCQNLNSTTKRNGYSKQRQTHHQIQSVDFAAWWNSDRLNPNLKKFKDSHAILASQNKGSGTMFG